MVLSENSGRALNVTGCELIYDLSYECRENIWQQRAQEIDAPFMDELSALSFQARRTFFWTGMNVLPESFLEALK